MLLKDPYVSSHVDPQKLREERKKFWRDVGLQLVETSAYFYPFLHAFAHQLRGIIVPAAA